MQSDYTKPEQHKNRQKNKSNQNFDGDKIKAAIAKIKDTNNEVYFLENSKRFEIPFLDLLYVKLKSKEWPLKVSSKVRHLSPIVTTDEPIELSLSLQSLLNGDWSNVHLGEPLKTFCQPTKKQQNVEFLISLWNSYIQTPLYSQLVKESLSSLDKFDPDFYLFCNPDLNGLVSTEEAHEHYLNHGRNEGRNIISKAQWIINLNPHYAHHPWDIDITKDLQEESCVRQDIYTGFDQSHALTFERYDVNLGSCIISPGKIKFKEYQAKNAGQCAIGPKYLLFHLFYEDIASQLLPLINKLYLNGFKVIISHCNSLSIELRKKLSTFNPEYVLCLNVGRDILGFQAAFKYANPPKNSVIYLMHTKKSPHLSRAFVESWKQKMINEIIGNSKFSKFCDMIALNKISLVANSSCREKHSGLGKCSKKDFIDYEDKIGLPFARGTMYLLSSNVLNIVFEKFTLDSFLEKPVVSLEDHLCGGIPHVIERVISYEALNQEGILWI